MNPRVFIDFAVDGEPIGRAIFELFADSVPKTAENFRALCTGEKGISPKSQLPLYFKNSIIHRSIPDFMIQGGDFTKRNGLGGESIYGGPFEDENLTREVDTDGLLVMANRGPNTNGSQFFITLRPCPHLNGKHVAFGRVVKGYDDVIPKIVAVPTDEKDRPVRPVVIVNCGELERRKAPAKREPSPSPTASDSDSERRALQHKRKKHKRHAASSSPSVSRSRSASRSPPAQSDGDQERKRKRKHKSKSKRKSKSTKHHEEDSSKADDQNAEPKKETEEEYDARLEREEKERLETERKAELARMSQNLKREEEERQRREPNRINYKGRGRMKFVDPEVANRRYDRH